MFTQRGRPARLLSVNCHIRQILHTCITRQQVCFLMCLRVSYYMYIAVLYVIINYTPWNMLMLCVTGEYVYGLINSLAIGRLKKNRYTIFDLILMNDGSCQIATSWMSLNLTDDKSTLVQVIAWYCQATSHYLNQCWPRFLSPYGVPKPLRFKEYASMTLNHSIYFPLTISDFSFSMYLDDVINWNIFRVTGHLCGELSGHR